MKAIVTVVGNDKVGIIARVSAKLAECEINILDISQTIMQDIFTMMMVVDIDNCISEFKELSEKLSEKGQELGVDIKIQRAKIFESMHRI